MLKISRISLLALLLPGLVLAGDGPLVTDRPDVTESAEVIRPGAVQIEAGFNFVQFDDDDAETSITSFPATLVRVGIADTVELRFDWFGYVSESRTESGVQTDDSGSGNTALGAKIKLRDERGAAPQLALLIDAVLPTGSKAFRSESIDPALRVAGSNSLSERLGLGWNLGIGALTLDDELDPLDSSDTHALGRYSVALGIGITERWGSFVEVFGFIPLAGEASDTHALDLGFTYLASDNVQLDISGGAGLTGDGDDGFIGAGFSIRLPR